MLIDCFLFAHCVLCLTTSRTKQGGVGILLEENKNEFNLNPESNISSALVENIVGHTRNVSKKLCMAISGKTLIMY